jgi:hypothetical protein
VRLAGSHNILDLVAARSQYIHNATAFRDGPHDSWRLVASHLNTHILTLPL